jgi:photosystem II stability/assembly factor-like uncharacterized protein
MKRLIILFLISFSSNLFAQWVQTNGPFGAEARVLYKNGNRIFLASYQGGYSISDDNGNTWNPGSSIFCGLDINRFAANSNYLFANVASKGMFRSSDNGLTWDTINVNLPNINGSYYIISVVATDSLIGICCDNTIYVSYNNGDTWINSNTQLKGILTHSLGKFILSASSPNSAIYTSIDLINWSQVPGTYGIQGGILKSSDSLIVLGTNNTEGFMVSRDLGSTWNYVTFPLDSVVQAIDVIKDTIIVAVRTRLYKSIDKGYTWSTIMAPVSFWCDDLIYDPFNLIYTDPYKGVFKYDPATLTWNSSNSGLIHTESDDFYSFHNNLFGKVRIGGWYKTGDEGSSWLKPDSIISNAQKVFQKDSLLIAFNNGIVYRSFDEGVTWQNNPSLFNNVTSITTNNDTLYISTSAGPYFSPDYGVNWVDISGNNGGGYGYTIYAEDGLLLLSTQYGFYRSNNNGATWIFIPNQGMYVSPPFRVVRSGQYLIAASGGIQGGIKRSQDYGLTWTVITPSITNSLYYYGMVSIANNLVTTNLVAGCLISNDYGSTWRVENDGLCFNRVKTVHVFKSHLYLGTSTNGVFKRSLADIGISSIEEQSSKEDLSIIYPNPGSRGLFVIESKEAIVDIIIYSVNGSKHVSENHISSNQYKASIKASINVEKAGMYLVTIKTEKNITTKKLIVF